MLVKLIYNVCIVSHSVTISGVCIFDTNDVCPMYHIWGLPVLHYHKIMVIYPYPFLVVMTQLFS